MALTAVYCFMSTGKFKAREIVVKLVFVKSDDVKIPAVVVAVANSAVFPLSLF